jgi:hypothetical protein
MKHALLTLFLCCACLRGFGGVVHCFNGTTNIVQIGGLTVPVGNSEIPISAGTLADFGQAGGVFGQLASTNDAALYLSGSSTNLLVVGDSSSALVGGFSAGLIASAVVFTIWAIVKGLRLRAPY